MIDISALNGLRGVVSIHIMMYHYYIVTGRLDLMASMEMPLFFLISGFSLTLGYGNSIYQGTTFWPFGNQGENIFNALKFYRNRFARIGPLYYLTNALCLSCKCEVKCVLGSPAFWRSAILTLTMTNSWTFVGWKDPRLSNPEAYSFPFIGVSWFMTTLSSYYLVYPLLLPALQTLTTSQLSSLIVWLFHFQCLPFLLTIRGTGMSLFWVTTAHPLTRLPVFIMGVAAGLVRLNGKDQNFNANRNFLHDIFPWGFSQPNNFESISTNSENLESSWRWKVDRNSILLIGLIVIENTFPYRSNWLGKMMALDLNTFSQFVCVHMQLTIIVGLTQDGGKSIVSKILRFGPMQFLGQISLAVYLIHTYVRDTVVQQSGMDRTDNNCIAASVATTLVVATVITKIFSQPMQNLIKAKKVAESVAESVIHQKV